MPKKNPVIFDGDHESDELTIYSDSLSEFAWKNRIVGHTSSGFLVVDSRTARKGYYEFHPRLLKWSRVDDVQIGRHLSIRGILGGIGLLVVAIAVFVAGWIKNTHGGPGVITIPLIAGIGGIILILGCIRNKITVFTSSGKYWWVSMPLNYNKTLSICLDATALCQANDVRVASHVEKDE